MRLITILLFVVPSVTCMAQVQFIGHRGASYLAPENTLASLKLGYELGADAVEIDVYLSSDNRVMVIHDKSTRRTCKGKNFDIKTTPSILLRELDAGSYKGKKFKEERIPFLSEVIKLIPPGKKLVVEIKCGPEILPYIKKAIEKEGKSGQIVFISFGWQTILDTKKAFPDNDCYWLSATKARVHSKMRKVKEAGLQGVNLKHSIIDKDLVALANNLNLEVLAWTVDDPEEAKRLIGLGVKYITTNRPKWLKEQVLN